MSEIGTVHGSLPEERWTLLAIARDEPTSGQWQDALDDAGVRLPEARVLRGDFRAASASSAPRNAKPAEIELSRWPKFPSQPVSISARAASSRSAAGTQTE